jgi:putative ABC transport system permease protein
VRRFSLSLRLALADLWAEPVMALCSLLVVAAVLAPLLVLDGLREGVAAGLREALLQDPHAREIVSAVNRDIPASQLAGIAHRPDVMFLVPRTRSLSAQIMMQREDDPADTLRVEIIPSARHDPLLAAAPEGLQTIVLSAAAAARLHAVADDRLVGRVTRLRGGQREALALELRVLAVAAPAATARTAAYVSLALATFIEDFQGGLADTPDQATSAPRAVYAGFRLYADRLESVPELDAALRGMGFDVVSRAGDVAGLLRVDRNLKLLFAIVAALGAAGFLIAMGAGLYANVQRKRSGLALLRFLGLSATSLALFPIAQAALLGAAGAAVAVAAAFLVAILVNHSFGDLLGLDRPLCVILPQAALLACGAAVAGACLVAAWAAHRASRLEPWEGVRSA